MTVRGERERGEVEALNRERTADNIVQVLPAEVITSLPNANMADALGRLPSVTWREAVSRRNVPSSSVSPRRPGDGTSRPKRRTR